MELKTTITSVFGAKPISACPMAATHVQFAEVHRLDHDLHSPIREDHRPFLNAGTSDVARPGLQSGVIFTTALQISVLITTVATDATAAVLGADDSITSGAKVEGTPRTSTRCSFWRSTPYLPQIQLLDDIPELTSNRNHGAGTPLTVGFGRK